MIRWYKALFSLLRLTPKTRVRQLDNQTLDQTKIARKRAQELLAAIDRGGIPLSPLIINRIARNLGLEVATTDLMLETIERIRQHIDALENVPQEPDVLE